MTWDPDVVKSWRIIGYENRVTSDASFAEDRKEFAELPSGTATTVFYEVELHDGVRGGADLKLGRVELRWVVPETGQSRSQQVEVTGRDRGNANALEVDPLLRTWRPSWRCPPTATAACREAPTMAPPGVSTDLAILQEELGALAGPLSGLDAYRDFRFLLERMAERAYSAGPAGNPLRLQPLARSAPAGHPDWRAPKSGADRSRPDRACASKRRNCRLQAILKSRTLNEGHLPLVRMPLPVSD